MDLLRQCRTSRLEYFHDRPIIFLFHSRPSSGSASQQPQVSASFTAFQEQITKTPLRPQTAPQIKAFPEPTTKSTRALPATLESIEENGEHINIQTTSSVPQPTKIDLKRDIQVLTLNDDGPHRSIGKKIDVQDQVPF